jgi:hypothetical protein
VVNVIIISKDVKAFNLGKKAADRKVPSVRWPIDAAASPYR